MGIAQQLDLGAGGHPVQGREAATIGEYQPGRIRANLRSEELVQHRAGGLDAPDYVSLRSSGSIPEQQLSVVIDALAIHCGDHARQRWGAKTRNLDGARRRLAESEAPVYPD